MAWGVWWALIQGFALSSVLQAWVSHQQMERTLGGRGLGSTLKATVLGAASSSCWRRSSSTASSRRPGSSETLPSIESITDRRIHFNYTAVLNILFTVAGAALVWLTVRRGVTDPVYRMRVDRYATAHRAEFEGRTYSFCAVTAAGLSSSPSPSSTRVGRGTPGGRARRLLRSRA